MCLTECSKGGARTPSPHTNMAFRKLWVHDQELEKTVFLWGDGEFAGHLIQLDLVNATKNMLKQPVEVMSLLCEVAGLEIPTRLALVFMVKKA